MTDHDDAGHEAHAQPDPGQHGHAQVAGTPLDLDAIERDLADVEAALVRLDAGTYWTDESTGEPLADDLLARRPTARTA
mgnify:CR=1 FL=1